MVFENVYVVSEYELFFLLFMKDVDILLSEVFSMLFEFVVLFKLVIVCNFFKLKWFYCGIFKYCFEKWFGKDNVIYENIGLYINSFSELREVVEK